jgi:hypothetical protein
MPNELETILRLVAEGRLTPEEAAPIVEALSRVPAESAEAIRHEHLGPPRSGRRQLRIRVTERGRQVVNLRIPIGFVDTALHFVPGLAGDEATRIRDAVIAGAVGPILDVEEEDGSGVLITVE